MKKLFFIFLYLVILSSVFALRTCWTSGDPVGTEAEEVISDSLMVAETAQRNVVLSNQRLNSGDTQYRLESLNGEVPFENYVKLTTRILRRTWCNGRSRSGLIFDPNG